MYPSKSFVAFDLTFWSMMHFKLIFYMKNSGTIYWKDYYFPFGFTCQPCWNQLTMNVRVYWRRQWHSTPVLVPGKSHGWRSLVACSPWGHEESDMTERLHFHFSLLCIGEGNGNPLQCSCLENPRDGVTDWTRLKWLSSSSSSSKSLLLEFQFLSINFCAHNYALLSCLL